MSDNNTQVVPADDEVKVNLSTKDLSEEDRKMLASIFRRSFSVFMMYAGAARAGADGFIHALMPAINRFYDTPEKRQEAMVRHSSWYNITQNVGTLCMGLVASMERENAEHPDDFDTESINAIKASLMGPMSGIGDAIFWGVLRVIAAAVGIAVGSTGSILGPILFLLIYNVPSILCRWWMTVLGYKLGTSFITKMYSSGIMDLVTKCASILGLLMIGAMTASFVQFQTILAVPVQGSDPIAIQTYLDAIFKGIVPLGLTMGCLGLMKKNVNAVWIIIGLMVLGMCLGIFGIC